MFRQLFKFLGFALNVLDRDFSITTTWDSKSVTHPPVHITLKPDPAGMRVDVHGPFFKSPSPPIAAAGQACPQLWDYEGQHHTDSDV